MHKGIEFGVFREVFGDITYPFDEADVYRRGGKTQVASVVGEGVEEGVACCICGLAWVAEDA